MAAEGEAYTLVSGLIDLGVVIASWLVGLAVTRFVIGILSRAARRSNTQVDDLAVEILGRYLPWWFVAAGAMATVRFGATTAELVKWVDKAALVAFTLSATLALASFVAGLLERRVLPVGGVGATTLTRKLVYWTVLVIGLLVLLRNLGIEITPVLAALGVGSLAVGLALQPTLTNVFAGFNLSLTQRLRVGDYVEIEGGHAGTITDIGWRLTEIRELPNNLILVPNSKLAEVVVKNFSLPDEPLAVIVPLGVSYKSDLQFVEDVTIDEGRKVLASVPGADTEFTPLIRFTGFGDSSINLVAILRARTFIDGKLVSSEFIKRIKARYDREGIEIPFPQRVLHFENGGGPPPPGAAAPGGPPAGGAR
jgi:small-conductance mechanosensitive channel